MSEINFKAEKPRIRAEGYTVRMNGLFICETTNNPEARNQSKEHAERIAACLNACEGISTENLQDNQPVKWLADQYNKTKKERDVLLAALEALQIKAECYGMGTECVEYIAATAAIASVKGGAL